VTLNVVNNVPTATNDSYIVHGPTAIGPFMANDSDPDGDSISFYGIVSNPTHGSLTGGLAPDRNNYTPAQGYVGSDSFTYRISDNLPGISNTATVTLNVVNNAPVPVADFYVVRGNTIVGPMLINDYDPDNDGIADFTLVTAPAHGSLAIAGQTDTKWFYPAVGYFGWDSFTYRVRDGLYLWSTATVYVLILPGSDPTPTTCSCPYDPAASVPSNPAQGGFLGLGSENASSPGPSGPDPVNLTTGREAYMPAPDLTVYNPNGPSVFWQRGYLGYQSLLGVTGYGLPGLARGWVQGYDITVQGTAGSWGTLKLSYPSGATENLTPTLSGGQPTGAFATVAGAPYLVSGVAGTPTGTWQSVTITWKDQTKWKFTLFSGTTYTLSQITSRTGQSINSSWNSSRALTQITDASTSTVLLTLAYGSNGKLATATDVYGRQIAYTFTAGTGTSQSMLQAVSQLVTSGTANPPARWTYTYTADKGQQLNTISVPSPTGNGNSTATINYDSVGKVTSLVDANGNQRVYTYNSGTTQVQVKDSANNVALSWTQKFNTGSLDTGITDAGSHSTTIAYTDTANPLKPTSVTDRNGHTATFTYDTFGNVLAVTTPRGLTTTYTWSYANFALGRLTSVQEGSKPATTISYFEPSGLINTVTRPEPNNGAGTTTTTYTYDSLGNVLTVVAPGNDATGSITTTLNYTTDGAYSQSAKIGQPLTVTDNLSHVTHLRYDSQGRTTSITDALGNETDFSYNLIGQPDTMTYPATGQTGSGHSHTTNAYLYVGGPLTTITAFDESNTQVRQVTRSYGLEGEALSVSGSTEPVTNTYDALYRVKTLKDGNNNTTTYAYNNIGLASLITMPGGETTQFPSYDNDGNLLQRIDGNGVVTNYLYTDSESLLTDIQYPASTSLNVQFAYDSYGRRSSMSDSTGSQSYSYGNLDELLSASTTYTGLSAKTISYAYYPNGSRQTMTTPAGAFSHSYDATGRPAHMTNPFSETTSWAYQNNDWLSTQALANGATANYTYNALGQVTRLLNQISGTTISDFSSIGYDAIGNRNSVTAGIPGFTSLSGITGYTYDTKDQITQESSTRRGGFTDNFSYDSTGNLTSFKGVTKSYNSNNQQTDTGFAYDGNGNPVTYSGSTLTFDPENRMTGYGSVLTAGYTGDGLRAWKENSSGRTYFLYDGIVPVVELDSSGSVTATNTFGASGLVSRHEGSASGFYSFDSEGNVAQRSDIAGTVLSNHLFNAHGSILSGTLSDPFGYKAQFAYYSDNETGLQLLTHRYYDPNTGRFLTEDPVGYAGGINVYSYTRNNPLNSIDPWGLQDGPINYLRDPFSSDHWILNAASNTISDMLALDHIAGWSWQVGNHCLPSDERAWAAAKGLGTTAAVAFGGPILKRVGGAVVSALGRRAGAAADAIGSRGPSLLGQEAGPAIPIPDGAVGPSPALSGSGVRFTGGSGGNGLNPRVADVRIMNPTARYPNGYASYSNGLGQTVNPLTGRTIAPSDSWWHIPLN
jgi:RHS repeat-associated protein